MLIRNAVFADVPRLVAMGGRFIQSSPYAGRLSDNPDARFALMVRLIDDAAGAVIVAEDDGAVVGMIGMFAHPHPWAGDLIGGEVFWWVEPEARGVGLALLKTAEQWAAAKGCTRVQMIAPDDRVARVFERLGYSQLEVAFQKDI